MGDMKNNNPERDKVSPSAKKLGSFFLTVGLAVVLIVTGTISANAILSLSIYSGEGVIKTGAIDQVQPFETNPIGADTSNSLRIVVNDEGEVIPVDAVTPQYATAAALEACEREFGKSFTDRVLVGPIISSDFTRWYVSAEIEGGIFFCAIDMMTGKALDSSLVFEEGDSALSWFDIWDKDATRNGLLGVEQETIE